MTLADLSENGLADLVAPGPGVALEGAGLGNAPIITPRVRLSVRAVRSSALKQVLLRSMHV